MQDKVTLPERLYLGDIQTHFRQWIESSAYSSYFILADSSSAVYCLPDLLDFVPEQDFHIIEIPMGEQYKNITICSLIWEELYKNKADRHSVLINLGGGVIGDMGGFAASTYMRGMDFVQVPTTLLAMVDASVGGKIAIDFRMAKNIIGLFREPVANFIDTRWLRTLPEADLRSGWAEVMKHAVIADAAAFDRLCAVSSLDEVDWEEWIVHSIGIKHRIVSSDPLEKGPRKGLNFGHTIGHAVETYFLEEDRPVKHGACVAIGMVAEAYISRQMAGLSAQELEVLTQCVGRWFPHYEIPAEQFDHLLDLMIRDKKSRSGRPNFTLIPRIGAFVYDQNPEPELIKEAIRYYNVETPAR